MIWRDYFAEGASVISSTLSASTGGAWEVAFDICGISIDLINDKIDMLERCQKLEADANIYLLYQSLLEIIIKNTTDPLLVKAAQYLLKITDLCYIYRMEHFDMIMAKEFDVFFSVLDKVTEKVKGDSSVLSGEWGTLSCLSYVTKNINFFKLGVDMGKFTWDVLIKASDTILRYYEICAMTSVREALIKEINKQHSKILTQQDWKEISGVRDLLIDLLYVNVRGEYCVYSLLTQNAKSGGIITSIDALLNGKEYKGWFDGVLNITNNLQRTIKNFFPDQENGKYDIYNNIVTDTYKKEFGGRQFAIPYINLSGDDVECINEEIWNNLYVDAVANIFSLWNKENYEGDEYISYQWTVYNGILSLLIESHLVDWDWENYYIYNIEISTGKRLSNKEIISNAGFTNEEYYKRAKQVLGSYYWRNWKRNDNNFYDASFVEYFNKNLKNTLSKENIQMSMLFFNDNGQLCIAAPVYSMAGSGCYWSTLNMEDFILLPYYDEYAVLLTHSINISKDEAYKIAYDYWNYTPEMIDKETGFELILVYDGLIKEYDGNNYYAFKLRWYVNEIGDYGHMSTIDFLYINAETGQCSNEL